MKHRALLRSREDRPEPHPGANAASRPALAKAWRWPGSISLICTSVALAACQSPMPDGLPDELGCSSCHGDATSPAPPQALDGSKSVGALGVGAHRAHLSDGPMRQALPCDSCHVVPEKVGDEGHVDPLPAEITWGPLARTGDVEPTWNRESATCSTTYCHGATLTGGDNTQPVWTARDQARCGACHGTPPPPPHPQVEQCHFCHRETVDEDGELDVQGGKHIDGELQVGAQTCNACHGGPDNPAPPVSTEGLEATTAVQVGAHQSHLRDGAIREAVACAECHTVPQTVEAPGHIDPAPAEVRFGKLARATGVAPSWDRDQATCSTTYCHGATLTGGQATEPLWTRVDGTQAQCDSCHGAPPPAPHPNNPNCGICHPGTVRDDGTIDVAGGLHIDGQLQVNAACNACHGSEANPAPPVSTQGLTETTEVTVGAHQAHLTDSDVRQAIACESCHVVPEDVGAEGHIDEAPAEVTFGGLAVTDNVTPSWDRDAATCATTYCHGATLTGGQATTPVWTQVDGTQAQCTSCHGDPPPPPHPQVDQCQVCHPLTVQDDGTIDVLGGHHIDGVVDAPSNACNACHGDDTGMAPPRAVLGGTSTTEVGVGAHRSHLQDGALRAAVACTECHKLPGSVDAPGHVDTALPAELTWGPLATAGGAAPAWDEGQATCSATYCHGATLTGGTHNTPTWTKVGAGEAACGACHGAPPPLPHPQASDCALCHPGTVSADGTIDVAGGQHIDGTLQAPALTCTACHGTEGQNPAPPRSTTGLTDTGEVAVGAHQAHLQDGPLRQAVACSECHVVPATVDAPGHADDGAPAEITWGPLAGADGAQGAWDRDSATCSNVYCHGATLEGGTNTTPSWVTLDGTQAACGTCHGAPPALPHPARTDCATCHPGTVLPDGTVDVAGGQHIDGILQAPALTCTACHGQEGVGPAPPASLNGATEAADAAVGAHAIHLSGSEIAQPIACDECHTVPTAPETPGHYGEPPAELTWGELATADGAAPALDVSDPAAPTCSNVYCHGATLSGGTLTEPSWNDTTGAPAQCGACHGAPPPSPHPAASDCATCHPDTVAPSGSIDVAGGKHVNGQLEVVAACDGCHGAPPATGSHLAHYAGLLDDVAYGDTRATGDFATVGPGYTFGCGNCHPLDPASHMNGVLNASGGMAEVELTPEGAPAGSLRSKNTATASYTPGAVAQVDARGFSYTTGGTCSNIYCHSAAGVSVPDPVPAPGADFPFTDYPIQYPPYDVNYARTFATPTWGGSVGCGDCHGFPPRTSVPSVQAGAGDSHSWIDADGYESLHGWNMGYEPAPCAACHDDTVKDFGTRTRDWTAPADGWSVYGPVPIADFTRHVNGRPDVAFTSTPIQMSSAQDLTTATYDPATKTCSNVACHLKQTEVTWGRPYRYMNTPECNQCHQY